MSVVTFKAELWKGDKDWGGDASANESEDYYGAYCWTRQVSNDNMALLKFRFDFSAMRAAKPEGSCSPSFLPMNSKTSTICQVDFQRFNIDEYPIQRIDKLDKIKIHKNIQ